KVRQEIYQHGAWPHAFGRSFRHGRAAVLLSSSAALALLFGGLAAAGRADRLVAQESGAGSFYRVLPYWAMFAATLAVSVYVAAILGAAFVPFLRRTGPIARERDRQGNPFRP